MSIGFDSDEIILEDSAVRAEGLKPLPQNNLHFGDFPSRTLMDERFHATHSSVWLGSEWSRTLRLEKESPSRTRAQLFAGRGKNHDTFMTLAESC
jgi:hypothetical protein